MACDGLEPGIYSELETRRLRVVLDELAADRHASLSPLRDAEAADRLSRHVASVTAAVVSALPEGMRSPGGAELIAQLIERLDELNPTAQVLEQQVLAPPNMLDAIQARRPDGTFGSPELPLTPLLDTTVLTNAPGEPRIQHELIAEVPSAVEIDVLMAFVRWSGVRPLLDALRRHCAAGRRVRLITTTYTNSTEAAALDALANIGVDIKVSYDLTTTRLHAKSWIFHRNRGATTAYIGSSNLTHSAQVTGLEWNMRV